MEIALRTDELLRAVELPVLPDATRSGHWKFCRRAGRIVEGHHLVLAVPGAAPRAVLAALDAALVIRDASALLAARRPRPRIVPAFPDDPSRPRSPLAAQGGRSRPHEHTPITSPSTANASPCGRTAHQLADLLPRSCC